MKNSPHGALRFHIFFSGATRVFHESNFASTERSNSTLSATTMDTICTILCRFWVGRLYRKKSTKLCTAWCIRATFNFIYFRSSDPLARIKFFDYFFNKTERFMCDVYITSSTQGKTRYIHSLKVHLNLCLHLTLDLVRQTQLFCPTFALGICLMNILSVAFSCDRSIK